MNKKCSILGFLILGTSLSAMAQIPGMGPAAPVQVMQLLEKNFPKACSNSEESQAKGQCPETTQKAKEEKEKLELVYNDPGVQAVLFRIYGPGAARARGNQDMNAAVQTSEQARASLQKIAAQISATMKVLGEREKVHAADEVKALLSVSHSNLQSQLQLVQERMQVIGNAQLQAMQAGESLNSLGHGNKGALSGLQEQSSISQKVAQVQGSLDAVVREPGQTTVNNFVDSVKGFCRNPGSVGLGESIAADCKTLESHSYGIFQGKGSYIEAMRLASKVMGRPLALASGSSRQFSVALAGAVKKVKQSSRDVFFVAGKGSTMAKSVVSYVDSPQESLASFAEEKVALQETRRPEEEEKNFSVGAATSALALVSHDSASSIVSGMTGTIGSRESRTPSSIEAVSLFEIHKRKYQQLLLEKRFEK